MAPTLAGRIPHQLALVLDDAARIGHLGWVRQVKLHLNLSGQVFWNTQDYPSYLRVRSFFVWEDMTVKQVIQVAVPAKRPIQKDPGMIANHFPRVRL